ncbi:MAG: TerB family tellurite resistance protein [Proteobacteria bacterium]|nr:TerB family tellurite resistance protein [Pseudomonadota bacterium]
MAHKEVQETFDKKNLTQVIFCAILMASIDGEIDKNEWKVIHEFVTDRWRAEFGPFKDVQAGIIRDLKSLLGKQDNLEAKLSKLTNLLGKHLDAAQKRVLIKLVEGIMIADGKMDPKEESLFDQFMTMLDRR